MTHTMIDGTQKPLQKADIFIQELGDELALCSVDSGEIHFLNTSAKLVWDLCDGHHSAHDMERIMHTRFELDAGQDILADINVAIESFQTKDLITIS